MPLAIKAAILSAAFALAAQAADLSPGAALCRSRIEAELADDALLHLLEVSEEGWGQGLVSTDILFEATNDRGTRLRRTATCRIRSDREGRVRLEEFFLPLSPADRLNRPAAPRPRP